MKLTYFLFAWAIFVVVFVSLAGYRGEHFSKPPLEIFPDMVYQDKGKDQDSSTFFADGVVARAPIEGTVAFEMPTKDDYWSTGKFDATHWGDGIPTHPPTADGPALAIDMKNLARGRERYTIYCAMCHGAAGDGGGIATKYGLANVANYHNDRLRKESDGALYDTIANGKNSMLGYGANISIDDRWRIVMYVRALQYAEHAPLTDAPSDVQQELASKKTAGGSNP